MSGLQSHKAISDLEILELMTPFLSDLTYDEIRQENFGSNESFYEIYNDELLVTTLRVFFDDNVWRVKKIPDILFLGTLVTDEFLVQENEDEIRLE